jgi:LemA protein
MGILFLILSVLLLISYFWYVGIIEKRNRALESLSDVDVQLKMRLDLIPNILKIAQKFMEHEKDIFTEVTELRTRASATYDKTNANAVSGHIAAVEQLSSKMGQLMLNVENYPQLKSDQTMVQAIQSYNEVEAQISAARRFYNSAVTELNNSVQIFPGNIIANTVHVSAMPFFKAEEQVNAPIDADKFLGK